MAKLPKSGTELVERIKKLAIISIFAEDEFLDVLVLKGGNALDLVLGVTTRASSDIDLSMAGAFDEGQLDRIHRKLESSLVRTFSGDQLVAFDVTFEVQPKELSEAMASFWGGYRITFKVIGKVDFDRLYGNIEAIRRQSIQVGGKGKIEIEISKFEYTKNKDVVEMDGYQVYVYSPAMIVSEKIRAICQQLPEYTNQVRKHTAARARDFLDIFVTVEKFKINTRDPEFAELVMNMFEAKLVPLDLLSKIETMRDFHKQDFASVLDTVRATETLKDFDFYFKNVVNLGLELHSLWHP